MAKLNKIFFLNLTDPKLNSYTSIYFSKIPWDFIKKAWFYNDKRTFNMDFWTCSMAAPWYSEVLCKYHVT